MGFIRPLDYTGVYHQIWMAGVEINDPRNDGFTQWGVKQDLWRLKYLLDNIIQQSPVFVGEDEFLKELDQERIMQVLKR